MTHYSHPNDVHYRQNKKLDPPFNTRVKSDRDWKNISPEYLEQPIHSYTIDDNDLKVKNVEAQIFEDFTYVKEDTPLQAGKGKLC